MYYKSIGVIVFFYLILLHPIVTKAQTAQPLLFILQHIKRITRNMLPYRENYLQAKFGNLAQNNLIDGLNTWQIFFSNKVLFVKFLERNFHIQQCMNKLI